jgi:CubicO group peptidase (beta-lactamase class C family)
MSLFRKFWDRLAPASAENRRRAGGSATVDSEIAGQIRPDEPGLAIAIVKSGTVVLEAGYGLADLHNGVGIAPDTIFHLASCGKQFTGVGLLMLAEAGKLDLDEPIGRLVPELAGYGAGVTVRRLLHHTSGIRDLYDEDGIDEVLSRCERPSNTDIINTYRDLGCPMAGRRTRPGDQFSYSNSGYDLLGTVIERVSGQSYHDFFQRRVFDRLGMRDTFSVPDARSEDPRRAVGYVIEHGRYVACGESEYDDVVGSGSFFTTVRDLCRYDHALATNALISAASMQAAATSGETNDRAPTGYGLGWGVGTERGRRLTQHEGQWSGYYSYMLRYLDQPTLGLFVLANNPNVDFNAIADAATEQYLSSSRDVGV